MDFVARYRARRGVHSGVKSLENSVRIGVAGPPGAGKSTFIEALGQYLIQEKNLVRLCKKG